MESIYFYSILLNKSIQDGKLDLPRVIVRKHGNILPPTVSIEVPTRDKWLVTLGKQHGKVWLGAGWPEFVQFYSMENGFFLEFKYDGDNTFHVIIFDLASYEIDYPPKLAKRSGNQQVPSSFTMKLVEAHFKSPNVCILREFARYYELENHENMILIGPDGAMSTVKCKYNPHRNLKYPNLFGSWSTFVKDYDIQIGDTCVFDLLEPNTFTLQVQIQKAWLMPGY